MRKTKKSQALQDDDFVEVLTKSVAKAQAGPRPALRDRKSGLGLDL
jgi:hypothetical protein